MKKIKQKDKKKKKRKAKFEFSAGGFIFTKGKKLKILLIKDSYGCWAIPKGHIENKEKPERAALREIDEEVGLENLQIKRKLSPIEYVYTLQNQLIFKRLYLFLVESPGEQRPSIDKKEIADAKWFALEEAQNNIGYNNLREALIKIKGEI